MAVLLCSQDLLKTGTDRVDSTQRQTEIQDTEMAKSKRATRMGSIRGIAHHNGIPKEDIHDTVMSILDWDLNDPISSLTELSDSELDQAYEGMLAWLRVERVRDATGALHERAKEILGYAKPDPAKDSLILDAAVKTIAEREAVDTQTAFQKLMDEMNQRGKSQLVRLEGSSGLWPDHKIIRTGSLDLDMCIGVGGIPRGRVVEIYGSESSGKTSLMLSISAQAQKQGMNVLYIDAENALDPGYAKKIGVNNDLFAINNPTSLQEAIQTIRAACEVSQNADMPDLLIVLDSVPALPAQEVEQADAEQQQFRALAARHWSQWMGTVTKAVAESNSTLMLINQTRTSMDMYTKLSDTTPGGKAIKFAASLRFEISRRSDDSAKTGAGQTGQDTTVKIVKNKVGSPFKHAFYRWNTDGTSTLWGIDRETEVLGAAIEWGGIHADEKFEDGEWIAKKNWYGIELKKGWLDAIREDEKRNWLEDNTDSETGEVSVDEDDFESEFADDLDVIQQYHRGPFEKLILEYPSLIDLIETATLNTLNKGSAVDDLEEVEEDADEDEDEDADY